MEPTNNELLQMILQEVRAIRQAIAPQTPGWKVRLRPTNTSLIESETLNEGVDLAKISGEDMVGNYADRKVARDDFEWGHISTALVTDGEKPYETAIYHKDFNENWIAIVECYDTRAAAEVGHSKWLATMTAEELPTELAEVKNSLASRVRPLLKLRRKQGGK